MSRRQEGAAGGGRGWLGGPLDPNEVAAAALLLLPLVLTLGALRLLAPPNEAQRAAADPLIRWLASLGSDWIGFALIAVICVGWAWRLQPDHPAFIISAHAAAHLFIPFAFV